MKFKKLEIAGFKSFADRLEVKFDAGVTAIVGPNGCGKSNVADAIRWVLGEQSAKLLRGNSMQDVIFNGTENRKSLSYCEVNLYFDNKDKQLFPSLEYDEVVISRKLYRSGESEYCLNRTICRLKDLTDLLRDGGMGREGYSIIGQGRIEELLRAKPEDRRAIFEEAAGISKFKARKLDAERKLARTRENMVRIEDILREKAALLEPLTKQSEAARKWLDLRDKLKHHEINIYIHQYETANQAKEVIQARLDEVIKQIENCQRAYDEASQQYTVAMDNINNADRDITALREELMARSLDIEKTTGDVKVQQQRLDYLRAQSAQLRQEQEQLRSDIKQMQAYISVGSEQSRMLAKELAATRIEAEEQNGAYIKVVQTLAQSEGEVESRHRTVVEAMDKLTDIRANMSRLLAEREGLTASVRDLEKRIMQLSERIEEDRAERDKAKEAIDALATGKRTASAVLDKLYETNNECVAIVGKAAEQIDSISAKYYTKKSQHKMLVEMQQSYEGFAYSVKRLLTDAKQNRELASHMEGVVASLLHVNEGFETAIETALGNAVQNIVTRTEEDAKFVIEYLKRNRAGRATFLPISSVKSRSLEPEYRKFLAEKGVCGIAVDLVSFDTQYAGIFGGLLGNTVVVENMDVAIALARKARYGFKIVTRDGEVLSPHGSITGGSKKSDVTNVFGYEKEIEKLSAELAEMDEKLRALNATRDARTALQRETSEKIRAVNEQCHAYEVEIAKNTELLAGLESRLTESENTNMSLIGEKESAQARIAAITSDIDSVEELENIVRGEKDSANDDNEEQRKQFDALRRRRDALQEVVTTALVKVTTLEQQSKSTEIELERLRNNLTAMTSKIDENELRLQENDRLCKEIDENIRAVVDACAEHDSKRVQEIRIKLSDSEAYKDGLQAALAEHDARRVQRMNELQQLSDRKSREEMQLLKVDTDIEQMQEKVKNDYELEYADCLPFKEEEYNVEKGMTEAGRLTRQMRALGQVNLASIDQCKEVYESYHEKDLQHDDLVKAEADLIKIIKELSSEMLGRFTGQFEQIRTNFVKIFRELFDGGTADLLLLDSENPLDAGIEIVAQPPEKKLQSISLLSGGERALTAIAILFAILRLKPMPFCVLDEIEAALDDANAGRFAKYLRRFSEDTQFIVITHRKPTMELADNLYGVTMEEKGVSKIVSVKLSEAMAMEEESN